MLDTKTKIKLVSFFGIFVGIINLLFYENNIICLIIGMFCILLSIGLLKSWKWVKSLLLFFSLFFILFYFFIFILTLIAMKYPGTVNIFIGISLFFYFPVFLLSLLFLKIRNEITTK